MKKARYIDTENIEIIDFDIFLMNVNKDFDELIKNKKITDDDLKQEDIEEKRLLREKIEKEREFEIARISKEYLNFIPCEKSILGEFSTRRMYYTKDADNVYEHEVIINNDKNLIAEKISELNNFLSSTDYIIIKSYEAKLSVSDAPYTKEYLDEILTKRQETRDKINELESLIK